ncbi:MAG TPA: quinol:electron acceptor oxidoreductase subunit ActD [Nitrospira sp.]
MAHPDDEVEVQALFKPDIDVDAVVEQLHSAGVTEECIHVLSPLPLKEKASDRIIGIPLYVVTFLAGLAGIGVGIFFAAGTAAMYPLMTGGKPIVAPPIVGIISYETMMLVAIVTTFVAMVIKIRSTTGNLHIRDARIDDGRIAVTVRVPCVGSRANAVTEVFERSGAIDLQTSAILPHRGDAPQVIRHAASVLAALIFAAGTSGCSKDMQEQASYQAQEAPRIHSPKGSVPRLSRQTVPVHTTSTASVDEKGPELYAINCLHCHGRQGDGDGPVAPFLKESPANLKGDEVRAMSEEKIYGVITHGKDMMPSFKGELSAEERWRLARFVSSLSRPTTPRMTQAEHP